MESQKQVIFPGTVSIVVFSLLFFIVRNFYQEHYDTTKKEIIGVESISSIHSVSKMIKHNIFLDQVTVNLKKQLEESTPFSNLTILEELEKVNNQKLEDSFSTFLEKEKDLDKNEIIDEYKYILKVLEEENFYIADNLSLFLEQKRDVSFLISIVIDLIPDVFKNIDNISTIGINGLNSDKIEELSKFKLDDNINDIDLHLKKISLITAKIEAAENSLLTTYFENIILEFKDLQMIMLNVQNEINEQTNIDYILKLLKFSNATNEFFVITKNLLLNKLQDRENEISFKLHYGTILYVILIIFTLMVMYRNFHKSNKLVKAVTKKKSEDKYIATLKESLLTSSSLKSVCEMSIYQLVKKFGAASGILYIYDDKNYKLYLGGTFGIDPTNVDFTLCIHDNLIGDCIIDHQFKITHSDLELNSGNKIIKVNELVTIPLINLDKSIGAVQLYFPEYFEYCDIDFLKRVIYIMSNNIYQSEQTNQTENYLKLIDKNIMVIKADLNGDIIDVSEEFCNLSEFSKEELVGQNHRIFKHEDTPQTLYAELWGTIKKGLVWRGEIKNRTKNGSYYWAENIIAPNVDLNGNITGYTGIKHDITSKKLVEELSITDALTGLHNRRYFDEVFKNKLLIAQRECKKLALTIVDIDYFKQYNDTYGHQDGDKALIAVASTIKSKIFRPDDYAFRIGGEEFAMLYFYKDEESAIEFSNRIRQSIENLHIPHSGHYSSKYVTISIGVKFITGEDLKDSKKAFKEADEALYKAKNIGRNRVVTVP